MSKSITEIRRPLRAVLISWISLTLLFGTTAPFVDVPWMHYLVGGSLYSLFLVVLSIGVALLGRKCTYAFVFVGMAVLLVFTAILFAILGYSEAPMDMLASFLPIGRVLLIATLAGLSIFSLGGWARYFRKLHNGQQPQSLPSADQPTAEG